MRIPPPPIWLLFILSTVLFVNVLVLTVYELVVGVAWVFR